MTAWFRRLLLILTIGGGLEGVAVTAQGFLQANKVIAYVMLLAFAGLYNAWPQRRGKSILQVVDHSAIFLLIASLRQRGGSGFMPLPYPLGLCRLTGGADSIPRALCVAHYPYLLLIFCHLRQTCQQHALPGTKLVRQPATCRSNHSNH